MSSRITIPNSLPVGVSLRGGPPPGAISSPAPQPGSQSFGVYNHVNNPKVGSSPYSNISPSINSAGSGVNNAPRPLTLSEKLAGRSASPAGPSPVVQPYRPSSIPRPNASDLSNRLAGKTQRVGGSPPVPNPSPTPRLNPRNLTRPLARIAPSVATVNRALPYIGAGLDFGYGIAGGESVGRAAAGAAGGLAGNLGGAAAGAAVGTLLLPGVGTAIGAVVGSIAGNVAGGWLADRLYDTLFPNRSTPNLAAPQERGPAPPFYGGQSDGISYFVNVYRDIRVNGQGVRGYPDVYAVRAYGPIRGLQVIDMGTYDALYLLHSREPISLGNTIGKHEQYGANQILNITREDGRPDTGGNPQPLPNAPNAPSLAPAIGLAPTIAPSLQPALSPSLLGLPSQSPLSPLNPANAPTGQIDPTQSPRVIPQRNPLAPSSPPIPETPETLPPATPESYSYSPPWDGWGTPIGNVGALPLTAGLVGGLAATGLITGLVPSGLTNRIPVRGNPPRNQPSTPPVVSPTPVTPTAPNTNNNFQCRFRDDPFSPGINARTQQMELVQLAIQAYQTEKLTEVNTKLGEQIPNGGIGGFVQKTWNFLQIDRVLNVLTYVNTLHNAIQLSTNVTSTLLDTFSSILDAIGIENADGSPINVSGAVNQWTGSFLNKILGEDTVAGMKSAWLNYSRIYQSAMNTIYTVNSIVDSTRSIVEIAGENVGKIGNALKRSGAIFENSFGWMQEKLDTLSVGNDRWNKLFTKIEQTEDALSSIGAVSSEVISIQENITQLTTNREELKTSLADVGFGDNPESKPVSDKESEDKLDSEAPVSLNDAKVGGIE